MKLPNLWFSALLVSTLSVTAVAADATPQSQDQAYREYLETYRQNQEDNRKNSQVHTIVSVLLIAGLVVFGLIPTLRKSREMLEIAKQQQKTLEEIRDLLKKRDT